MELIAFIILCYIIYRVFFKKKKPDVTVTTTNHDPVLDKEYEEQYENYRLFKNEPVVIEHFHNIDKIDYYYKVANALENKYSTQMEQCIMYCCRDIDIYSDFETMCIRYEQEIRTYPAFTRLAIIYEKRHQYDEAVDVCTQALKLKYDENGDIYTRLARLLKKTSGLSVEDHLAYYNISIEV